MAIDAGTELTCKNPECDCSLVVQQPCSMGSDDYKCGCGSTLVPATEVAETSGVVTSRPAEMPTSGVSVN